MDYSVNFNYYCLLLIILLYGTLMSISKSVDILAKGFTLVFEIAKNSIFESEMFVCKYTETIEYVNKQTTFFEKIEFHR